MLWFDKHRQDKRVSDGRAKVVIVGAGFGGMEAAKSLSRAPVEVTVINRQNRHCFQPLSLKQAWLLVGRFQYHFGRLEQNSLFAWLRLSRRPSRVCSPIIARRARL
jgi:choline dehydrogenase-like flavoprotein